MLFCDLVGSTALGERLDAESVRTIMSAYFEAMRAAIERHGGTVEKFVGDAVMAVFGVPVAHEDDALRALRAACEMRERLRELNDELERRFELTLSQRIGVNTGEVVAADPAAGERFVSGDAVNVAARLEQAAGENEILLGELTEHLTRSAIAAEPLAPLRAKGKREPLRAYRLLSLAAGPAGAAAPLVGRAAELAVLEQLFEHAVSERECKLATIVGEPGVGKTRLADELLDHLAGRARILTGHCLSYGEGITYWPLAEIVRAAASITDEDSAAQARAKLTRLAEPAVAAALGLGGEAAGTAETGYAFGQLFDCLAADQPLLLLIEDLHWAEETLLDLLERLAARARSPILLVCTARPDLIEQRPQWPVELELEPLTAGEIDSLLAGAELSEHGRRRVRASCGGNPLFAEELAAYLHERPGDQELPPSLSALLAARLDLLPERERGTLELAAIEGERFHQGALVELSKEDVMKPLESLLARELIRPTEAGFADEAGFRFKHVLVRDAAYNGTAKQRRAEQHERFAGWLQRKAGERVAEYDELLGYHLEQAYRYRTELAPPDDTARELAERGARRLGAAGSRAYMRGDMGAAANLLHRARSLYPQASAERLELLPQLWRAHWWRGEDEPTEAVLEEAVERATTAGNGRIEWDARLDRGKFMVHFREGSVDDLRLLVESAMPVLEGLGDELVLGLAWERLADVFAIEGRYARQAEALAESLVHTRRAGDRREEVFLLGQLADTYCEGPLPAPVAIEECNKVLAELEGDPAGEAYAFQPLAILKGMTGEVAEGRRLLARARAVCDELGVGTSVFSAASLELLAGDPAAAESLLRGEKETEISARRRFWLDYFLARALVEQGRIDDAAPFATSRKRHPHGDSRAAQTVWRGPAARVLAAHGKHGRAEKLAREAVAIAATTDALNLHADALLDLAEVLRRAERPAEAAGVFEEALTLYQRKGNVISAERVRATLLGLGR